MRKILSMSVRSIIMSILVVSLMNSCAKVGTLKSSNLDETFSGSLAIVPYDKTKTAKYYTHIVSIYSDGETVTLYGILGPLGSISPCGTVSGLVGNVLDKEYAEITGFASMDETAESCHVTAEGKIRLDRKRNRLYTVAEDHVLIAADVKDSVGNVSHEPVEKVVFTGSIATVF